MAYEFIKGLFGTNEDGTPRALTADQLEAAIEGNKDLSIVNLKDGGYISFDKYSRVEAERNSLQEQLKKASAGSGSGQGAADQDLQAARQQIEELQKQLQLQGRRSAISEYLSGYKFSSSFAKKGILAEMEKLDSVTVVDGELIGAEAAMANLKTRYAEAFKAEDPADPAAVPQNVPRFTSTSSLSGTGSNPKKSGPMTLSEAMRYKNEHPNADVSGLFNR